MTTLPPARRLSSADLLPALRALPLMLGRFGRFTMLPDTSCVRLFWEGQLELRAQRPGFCVICESRPARRHIRATPHAAACCDTPACKARRRAWIETHGDRTSRGVLFELPYDTDVLERLYGILRAAFPLSVVYPPPGLERELDRTSATRRSDPSQFVVHRW